MSPKDFIIENNLTHGRVLKSRKKVRSWTCRKISDTKYEVITFWLKIGGDDNNTFALVGKAGGQMLLREDKSIFTFFRGGKTA